MTDMSNEIPPTLCNFFKQLLICLVSFLTNCCSQKILEQKYERHWTTWTLETGVGDEWLGYSPTFFKERFKICSHDTYSFIHLFIQPSFLSSSFIHSFRRPTSCCAVGASLYRVLVHLDNTAVIANRLMATSAILFNSSCSWTIFCNGKIASGERTQGRQTEGLISTHTHLFISKNRQRECRMPNTHSFTKITWKTQKINHIQLLKHSFDYLHFKIIQLPHLCVLLLLSTATN